MLYDDDVPAYAEINVDDYADKLMTWGKRNHEATPGRESMRLHIVEWTPLWRRLRRD
jgi:hypothetical protein